MKPIAYGKPLLINAGKQVTELNKIEAFDEDSIQDLIFRHPDNH